MVAFKTLTFHKVSTLPPLPNTFTRKEQTTLNRLLIGHICGVVGSLAIVLLQMFS